ncbi:MAG: hypothetical protein ACD_39C01818G0003 [uncultured bacterium]|nr:MAG: hypothetical protein ACD_39C01818G0003 [uncultured bacterium]
MKCFKTILVAVLFPAAIFSPAAAVEVKSDPRVELCSLVFYLAGAREYSMCRLPAYLDKVNSWFAEFKGHEIVPFIQQLRREHGVSYDAVMKAAILIRSVDKIEPLLNLDEILPAYEERWQKEKLLQFYALLADFAQKSRFMQFYDENAGLFKATEESAKSLLAEHKLQNWFDKSFPEVNADFILVPAYINGPACYGPGLKLDGRNYFYCIFGVSQIDDNGMPVFSESAVQTIFHEFCHSHTNPLADKYFSELEKSCSKMFELAKEELTDQAYGTSRILLYESLVRACTGAFVQETLSAADYGAFINKQEKLGFYWIEPLAMQIYEFRQKNISLETSFPEIIALLNGYAGNSAANVAEIRQKWEAEFDRISKNSPRIIESSIKNSETGVSEKLATFTIKFDRQMLKQWAVIDTQDMPEIPGEAGFDKSMTIFSVPVKLDPAKNYTIQLNSTDIYGFKDSNGNPLIPTTIRFRTRELSAEELAAVEKERPRIVRIVPDNGAQSVAPATDKIVIEFSEPMQNSWSLVGGGEPFPEVSGSLYYDQTGKILIVPVKLKPDHNYWLWINSEKFTGFCNKAGIPVLPQKYEFKTAR